MTTTQAQIEAARKAFVQTLNVGGSQLEALTAAVTTAAEVVESSTSLLSTAIENVKAETIERCAQVADEPKDIYGIGAEIAAAIRALKG